MSSTKLITPPGPSSAHAAEPKRRTTRVLMVVESSAGGTGRHVLDLSEGLAARGCEVHLLYSAGRADRFFLDRLSSLSSVRHAALSMRTSIHPSDLSAVRAIRRHLLRHGPFDAVHGHSSKGGALARLSALATGVPSFYTLHGFIIMDPGLARAKRLFYLAIECALSRVTSRVIAVSPEEGRAAVRLGLGKSRVVVVPNGIAPPTLTPRREARASLGLDPADDGPVIGFVGRLVTQKAPEVLLSAFADAARTSPGARLALVGSGPLGPALRRLAEGLGVADRVLWLGERDARGLLAGFDVFALSSRKEGLPYVVLEAMAAGLPVVATTTAGVEILVESGSNGFVVPAGDTLAFGAALAALAADPGLRARQSRAARERAARFSIDAMVDLTLDAYHAARPAFARAEHASTSFPIPIPKPFRGDPTVASPTKPRSAELHPGPGFRVRSGFIRPDPNVVARFREFPTPDISDLLNRLFAVNPSIRCLTAPEHVLCGPACTVKVFPGDNLMVHKSLDVARPGDVVVVDAAGATTNAVLGDLISAKAKHRGIAGFVVDGLVRDLPAIDELDFPVFARGTTPIGPLHRGPGEINYPICCGGIVVNPGDLIVGDAAGVIVVPREIAAELIQRLEQHQASNRTYFESVRRGEFSNAWVDRVLEEQRCLIVAAADPSDSLPIAPLSWNNGWPTSGLADEPLIDGAPRAVAQA